MGRLFCVFLLVVSGCNQPGRHFADVPVARLAVDGSVFDVRVRGNLAEALRVNPQYAPRLGSLRGKAAFAMGQVSGCAVLDVLGDQAQMTGVLRCSAGVADWRRAVDGAGYTCLEVAQWLDDGYGPAYPEFDCDPI